MTRILVGATAMAAVLLTGLVHGYWTERWASRQGPSAAAAARMDALSNVLGQWEGEPMDAAPRQTDGITGHVYRRYVHRQNGHSVAVALFCGRSGPVSIHTPDVCYAGSGYDVGTPSRHTIAGRAGAPPADFKTAQFFKTSATDRSQLRIFWSWNATGAWTVPDNPRFAFAHRPFLYKLYVIREMTESTESLEGEPCRELMELLVPELQRCLFPTS
jgi:hypothetical protein